MNKSNSHNTSQLIHAGVELVVGACITFWLNRKISSVSQKVSLLEDKLKFYESMLSQHHELIKKLFSILETTSHTAKMGNPVAATKITSKIENMKTNLLPETTAPTLKEEETFSVVEPSNFIHKTADSTAELDAILSVEIEDLKTNQHL